MLSIPERLVCAQLECVTSTCCPDSVQTNYLLVMHVVQGVPQWLKEPTLMEDIAWIPSPPRACGEERIESRTFFNSHASHC